MRRMAIIGGTGAQGRAVMDALKASGRDAISISRAARSNGEHRAADLDRPESLPAALEGVETLVLVVPSLVAAANGGEARRGISAIDAAIEAGVRHVIYSSALARGGVGVLGLGSKRAVEERLRESGLGWSIIRPAFFMDNFATFFPPREVDGVLTIAAPLPLDRPTQMVAARDIGAAIAAVASDPEQHDRAEIDLVAEALSLSQIAGRASQALHREVRARALPPEALAATWPQGVPLFRQLSERGTSGSQEPLRTLIGEPTSFSTWVTEHALERAHAQHGGGAQTRCSGGDPRVPRNMVASGRICREPQGEQHDHRHHHLPGFRQAAVPAARLRSRLGFAQAVRAAR